MRFSRPWMRRSASWLLVVGTGLMGGSVARAARRAGVVERVYGYDPENGREAQGLGLIDLALPALDELSAAEGGRSAPDELSAAEGSATGSGRGLVVLAAPVSVSAYLLRDIALHWEGWGRPWVTDLGSTKAALIQATDRLRTGQAVAADFLSHSLASHPMAGSEAHGPAAARAELFEGARVLLSAFPETSDSCLAAWEGFWQSLGARTHPLALAEHDPLLAAISHLPHAVAYALAAQLAASPQAESAQWLHGGGLRDTTRIAASSPSLWADIFLDNREALLGLLERHQSEIAALCRVVQAADRPGLIEHLEGAARWRAGFQDPRATA